MKIGVIFGTLDFQRREWSFPRTIVYLEVEGDIDEWSEIKIKHPNYQGIYIVTGKFFDEEDRITVIPKDFYQAGDKFYNEDKLIKP